MALVDHIIAIAESTVTQSLADLRHNTDSTMRLAADAAWSRLPHMPHEDYFIPEKTPDASAFGKGRPVDTETIQQFGSGSLAPEFSELFEASHKA
jgi:hypothetical protein